MPWVILWISIIRCLTCTHLIYKYHICLYNYFPFTITNSLPAKIPPMISIIYYWLPFIPNPNHNAANKLLVYTSRTHSFAYSPHEYTYTSPLFTALCSRIYRQNNTSLHRFRLTLPLSVLYPHNLFSHIVVFENNWSLSWTLCIRLRAQIYHKLIYLYVYVYIRGAPCGIFSRLNYLKSRKSLKIIIENFKEIFFGCFIIGKSWGWIINLKIIILLSLFVEKN